MTSLRNSFLLAFVLSVTVNVVGVFICAGHALLRHQGREVPVAGYTTLIYGGIVLAAGYKFVYSADGIVTGFLQGLFPGWIRTGSAASPPSSS